MQNMKKLPLIVLIGSLSACGGDHEGMPAIGSTSGTGNVLLSNGTVTTPPAATPGTATPGAMAPDDSNAFLVAVYQDGLAEIQLSELALQKTTNDDVRQFAQRMIDHHTALNDTISQLAQGKNVALPTTPSADQQTQTSNLSTLPAEQFDLAYLQQNLAVHEKDVAAARLQAQQGTDADVQRLARTALPLLKTHLAAAEEIAADLDPARFLTIAYREGLAEIQLSQLALTKAADEDVRAFAQRMIDEHTQANAQMAALAQQKNISLPSAPSAEHQAIADELSALSGADFDEAYMDVNVVAHAKSVRLFRKQANRGQDPDIKDFAADTAPDLTEHLFRALEIDRSVEPSFPYRLFQDGEAEIVLSQLALLRSTSDDVKAYAQRMIAEHSAANARLLQLARQNNRAVPTELAPEHLLALYELARLSGREFDRIYMEINAAVHEKDVEEAREALQSTDAAARALAQAALPTLDDHLAQARTLREQLEANASQAEQ